MMWNALQLSRRVYLQGTDHKGVGRHRGSPEGACCGRGYTQRALTHARAAGKAAEAHGGTRPGGLTGTEAEGRAPDVTLFLPPHLHWLIPAGSPRDREPREVVHLVHPQGRGQHRRSGGCIWGGTETGQQKRPRPFF